MRIEIGEQRPIQLAPQWPGQFDLFSHFEMACGIPHVLFAITTLKENGLPNVCLHSWSCFTGGGDCGYFAVLGGISRRGHTYANIRRTGEFVLNFLSKDYFEGCLATIEHNGEQTDELAAGGFTAEAARTVGAPRLHEAFLVMECRLEQEIALPGSDDLVLLLGRATHIGMGEAYADGLDSKYGARGFLFSINEPVDLTTGKGNGTAVAVCDVAQGYGGDNNV